MVWQATFVVMFAVLFALGVLSQATDFVVGAGMGLGIWMLTRSWGLRLLGFVGVIILGPFVAMAVQAAVDPGKHFVADDWGSHLLPVIAMGLLFGGILPWDAVEKMAKNGELKDD